MGLGKLRNRPALQAILFFLGTLVVGLGFGLRASFESPLFAIQAVEVAQSDGEPKLSQEEWLKAAGLSLGEQSLVSLSLRDVENALLKNEWIESVALQKKFPGTLQITPSYRVPLALFLKANGQMGYLDAHGKVFSEVRGGDYRDLPVVHETDAQNPQLNLRSLEVISAWTTKKLDSIALLSSISCDIHGELKVSVGLQESRLSVYLDYKDQAELMSQLDRLSLVFKYLSSRHVPIRTLWANSGKKIVVKKNIGS